MNPFSAQALRVAIVGASSLRGKELKRVLGERSFPAKDVRLLDEDLAVGTMTEAAGEPAIIAAISPESFEGVRFAFFAGAPGNTGRHWRQACQAGATVIDLSDGRPELADAVLWIPRLDPLLAPLREAKGGLFRSPAPAAIVACSVAAALAAFGIERIVIVFFQPVSERGQRGIDELESQTINLLSFKSISQEVYDAQVAFNLLAQFGEASGEQLADVRAGIVRDVAGYLAGRVPNPAIQLVQAPVFYGYAFTAYVELASPHEPAELEAALASAGIQVRGAGEPAPSNVSVVGENQPAIARIQPDPERPAASWLWGAVDNLALAAENAAQIAEKLLAP